MAKKRVSCPDCGHAFTTKVSGVKTAGVRARPTGNGGFNFEVTVPENTDLETGHLTTLSDDLTLDFVVSCAIAGLATSAVSLLTEDIEALLYTFGNTAGACFLIGALWFRDERRVRLKVTLPRFMRELPKWPHAGGIPVNDGAVTLTVDHRYRDGNTEAGRTVEYFGPLPVDAGRFGQWAAAVLGNETVPGVSLSHGEWTPLSKGKLFARTEYEPLLAQMVKGGTVVNKPGKGHILTGGGRRALRQHLKSYPPTPLGSAYNG